MPTIVAEDGARLYFRTRGDGPAVFLVHGGTGTGMYDWGAHVPRLSRRYRVVVPDLRGHGRSDDPSGRLAIDVIGEDLELLATAVGRPAAIVAFSIGAAAAVGLLRRRPDLTDAVVLIGAALSASDERAQAVASGPWPGDLVALRHEHALDGDHWRRLRAALAHSWGAQSTPRPDELSALAMPALVACGDRDPVFPVADAARLAGMLPSGELLVVPGAGHPVMRDRPREFGVLLDGFLARSLKRTCIETNSW
jgi:pimeloyl-ACP methyl ester carboxylesterase